MKTEVSLLGLKNCLSQTTTPKPKININNKIAAGRDCTFPFEAVYCMPPVLCSSHWLQSRPALPRLTPTLSLLKLCIVCLPCFVQVMWQSVALALILPCTSSQLTVLTCINYIRFALLWLQTHFFSPSSVLKQWKTQPAHSQANFPGQERNSAGQ
jgi:hypothetical protein